jgi:hypothetical protein
MSNRFPASIAVNTYIAIENMLVDDVLRVIPYCNEHENVWSPILVTILLEACSQLDSLWKYQAAQSRFTSKEPGITNYFSYYGEYMSSKWVVFYGEEPTIIRPFDNWRSVKDYKSGSYKPLDWWSAYNKVKHNRLENRTEATLKHSICALAGLFTAILRFDLCRNAIAQAGWLIGDGYNLQAWLGEDSPSAKSQYITAESKLFTYPVGWDKEKITRTTKWEGVCSLRFRDWLDQFTL